MVTSKRKILNCVFTLIIKNNKIKIFRLSYNKVMVRNPSCASPTRTGPVLFSDNSKKHILHFLTPCKNG